MILVQLVTCLDQRLVNKLNPLADRLAGSSISVSYLERADFHLVERRSHSSAVDIDASKAMKSRCQTDIDSLLNLDESMEP